jgi:hypothetical protein
MELPEDVRKLINNDRLLDLVERLGSDDDMTEKTIELDEGTGGVPGIFEEEKEKRLDGGMKKKMEKQKKRWEDVDVDNENDRPPTPTKGDTILKTKWDKSFAQDDKKL